NQLVALLSKLVSLLDDFIELGNMLLGTGPDGVHVVDILSRALEVGQLTIQGVPVARYLSDATVKFFPSCSDLAAEWRCLRIPIERGRLRKVGFMRDCDLDSEIFAHLDEVVATRSLEDVFVARGHVDAVKSDFLGSLMNGQSPHPSKRRSEEARSE